MWIVRGPLWKVKESQQRYLKKNSSDTTATFCVLQSIILIKYPSFKYSTILEHFFVLFFYLNNWDTIEGIERQRSVTQTQAMYEKRRVERIFANDSLRTIFSTLKLPEIFFYCSTFISAIIQWKCDFSWQDAELCFIFLKLPSESKCSSAQTLNLLLYLTSRNLYLSHLDFLCLEKQRLKAF